MARQRVEKQIYTEVVATSDGEVSSSKTIYKGQSEPEFVKLYIDCVLTVKGARKVLNPIFVAFLKFMSYADSEGELGGQTIYVNKAMKTIIAKRLGLGIDSINKALSEFTKHGLFKRVDVGTYQVNPNIVGRGEWKDIKNIRATFDFGTKEIIADIVKAEEKSMTENQQELKSKYEQITGGNMNGETNNLND